VLHSFNLVVSDFARGDVRRIKTKDMEWVLPLKSTVSAAN